MNSIAIRPWLLAFMMAGAVLFTGCEEAVTGVDNDANVPSIDGDNTPFVEIATGNEGDTLAAPVELVVQSNVAVDDVISVEYEVSGAATEGDDYVISPPSPITIEFDTSTTDLESASINVEPGDNVTEATTAEVTLTSVSTEDGTEVRLGRGEENLGISRTVAIVP